MNKEEIVLKKCSKCGEEFPTSYKYFGKDKYNPDGYARQCKICIRKYREEHRQEIKQYAKKYREEHKKEKEQYYKENEKHIKQKHKEYNEKNKEQIKQKRKENGYDKKYREKNKEQIKKRRQKNREKTYELEKIKRYNIMPDEYNLVLQKQNNKCAICKNQFETKRRPATDHCHISGKFRGILCHQCNITLGIIKENTDTLKAMIIYLESNNKD